MLSVSVNGVPLLVLPHAADDQALGVRHFDRSAHRQDVRPILIRQLEQVSRFNALAPVTGSTVCVLMVSVAPAAPTIPSARDPCTTRGTGSGC